MTKYAPRDELDWAIIDVLRKDGRTPNKTIASLLGITEVNVAARIKWLRAHNVMAVTLQRDLYSQGCEYQCLVEVFVRGRAPIAVAKPIASMPGVLSVNLLIGKPQIMISCGVKSRDDLHELVYERIARMKGVERVATHVTLHVHKYDSIYVDLHP